MQRLAKAHCLNIGRVGDRLCMLKLNFIRMSLMQAAIVHHFEILLAMSSSLMDGFFAVLTRRLPTSGSDSLSYRLRHS